MSYTQLYDANVYNPRSYTPGHLFKDESDAALCGFRFNKKAAKCLDPNMKKVCKKCQKIKEIMSFKSSPSDEFLETFRKYDSQDSEVIDVAYSCWSDLKDKLEEELKVKDGLYMSAVKGRKDLREALRVCRAELKALQDSQR